ncbi:MAG: tRNA uridine-5-carboxymethylaminomethyl(34) synthesis GTPase MnmE [Bacteroidales bacterium]|nr:tRNA uridine-5-carboxymethylaminomethyl(34) synthesis GTPase MnmE [Bacteroidales bacterium]
MMKDTICAISTPAGIGAIAVVRASGDEAFEKLTPLFPNINLNSLPPQSAKFTQIFDNDQVIDQVVVLKFAAPHSYTGENMVEISCHGSLYIQKKILELMIEQGCRMAQPGEFTQRAFLNGKLDLPQAEAVADLIDSQSESTHKLAINQLKGSFSKKLNSLREQLVQLGSLLELELDFSEEEVEFANREELNRLLDELGTETDRLLHSFKVGNALKTGIPVAIVGQPNVGKSTLLNTLLQHDRAIVSPIPGTTRDTVEDTFVINGTPFRFIDTAGIRQADDSLESIGIERTFQAIDQAAIIFYMVDASRSDFASVKAEVEDFKASTDLIDKQLLIIANKIDELKTLPEHYKDWHDMDIIFISAKRQVNIGDIENRLVEYIQQHHIQDVSLLTNERHYALLSDMRTAIGRIRQGLADKIPTDLLAEDVRIALYDIGSLTGTISTDELLDNIFGKFCIGK